MHDDLTGDDAIRALLQADSGLPQEPADESDEQPEPSRISAWKAAEQENLDRIVAEREAKNLGAPAVNRGAYDVDAIELPTGSVNIDTNAKRKFRGDPRMGDTTERIMKPEYTFSKGGGGTKRTGEDAKKLKLKKYMGRPWIEDEPRCVQVGAVTSETTRRALQATGRSTSDMLYLLGKALNSGRTFEEIVALETPRRESA